MISALLTFLNRIRQWNRGRRHRNTWRRYENLPTSQVFEKIYEEGEWGRAAHDDRKYYSGSGSVGEVASSLYQEALRAFLVAISDSRTTDEQKLSVVDVGCGDFFVGSQIRPLFGTYVAVDVAANVIAYNREKHAERGVDFRVLNVITDELPVADVYLIRQVLQHLSNSDIKHALSNLSKGCRYLIVTEHVPSTEAVEPNVDITTGPETRLAHSSAVVLTAAPFNFVPLEQQTLLDVPGRHGRLVTVAYTLQS